MSNDTTNNKSDIAKREEDILAFWKEHAIFEKSLEKEAPRGEFVFYEGPPTANGRPGIHHVEARAFKDIVPRFRTMRGYHVRRKGGWDTHGLPVELQVEKELGLSSKKDIETYGIAAFNKKCKESVWQYVDEWKRFTERIAYWVDLANAYITYTPEYIESLWSVVAHVAQRGLLYKDYKVVPWCPRCGTALSSHELAQGYADVDDESVSVKFKVTNPEKAGLSGDVYLLAWTTTPWTLPGNVALAVGEDIAYATEEKNGETLVYADDGGELRGNDLIGLEYEPLFPFLKEQLEGDERKKLDNAYKVYAADFVSTEEGTGIVHTAVMYGADDFALGTEKHLPKHHLVGDDGRFLTGSGFLEGVFIKDANTDIIADLENRKLLFEKKTVHHTYPFCWRCKTPLIYFARDSWYIRMSELRDELLAENEKIHWEPSYIKDGRFGEWLRDVKDWAVSRERYWGTPLPVWKSEQGNTKVVGSLDELKQSAKTSGNRYLVMRHGESESNAQGIISSRADNPHGLTERGKGEARRAAGKMKTEKVDLVIASPFVRTTETANMMREGLGLSDGAVVADERLGEINLTELNNKPVSAYGNFAVTYEERFANAPKGGETIADVRRRVGELLYEIEEKYQNKTILLVTHEYPTWMLETVAGGLTQEKAIALKEEADDFISTGEVRELSFVPLPHNEDYEIDLHRPYIDEVVLEENGEVFHRVPEVMDVWFDSGAMPFAQDHYPMENREWVENEGYPADYIAEAIDQTRGWFYTLHAVGVLMERGRAYNNVISLGHVLDKNGKKMSKSVGNVVDPWEMIEKYGVDALRVFMYTVNQPGDSKNFDEKAVDEIVKKMFRILENVHSFYALYAPSVPHAGKDPRQSPSVLDVWILVSLDTLIADTTRHLEAYRIFEPARELRSFILDLSQWYVRRSRARFKNGGEDAAYAAATLRHVLLELSKVMAPFTPFFAEWLYREIDGEAESVHLEAWPKADKVNKAILLSMKQTRLAASHTHEARLDVGIKVRQPLSELRLNKDFKLSSQHEKLVMDEVNIKKITYFENNNEIKSLDKNKWQVVDDWGTLQLAVNVELTPDLRAEGVVREFLRHIQDMRKKAGLSPSDTVQLVVETDENGKRLIKKFESDIKKTANISGIVFNKTHGEEIRVDEYFFIVGI